MSIEEMLRKKLRQFNLEKAYDATVAVEAAKRVSKGEFEPISFRHGTLKIKARSVAAAHKLKLREDELLNSINKESKMRVKRLFITSSG